MYPCVQKKETGIWNSLSYCNCEFHRAVNERGGRGREER